LNFGVLKGDQFNYRVQAVRQNQPSQS